MKKERFTKTFIERLEAPVKGRRVVWDAATPGFAVVVYPSGRKSFCVTYRGADGRDRQLKVGVFGAVTLEKAREVAAVRLGEIAMGEDPKERMEAERERRRRSMTLEEFWPMYWRDAKARLKQRTLRDYDDLWRNRIKPALGKRRLDTLGRRDVVTFHMGMDDVKTRANRALATLRAALSFAVGMGLMDRNPALGVRGFREKRHERFLSAEELGRFFGALDRLQELGAAAAKDRRLGYKREGEDPAPRGFSRVMVGFFRLVVFTGARAGEIRTARWEYWDRASQTLRLPDSKTGAKVIYLNSLAVEELEALWNDGGRDPENPWVIPGRVPGRPLAEYKGAWARLCEAAKLEKVRVHDLRHSFGALAVGSGLGLFVLGRALGHSNPATTNRYAHLVDDPLRAGVELVGDAMRNVIDGTKKVVELDEEKGAS